LEKELDARARCLFSESGFAHCDRDRSAARHGGLGHILQDDREAVIEDCFPARLRLGNALVCPTPIRLA
jgi:hypothetical protein